MEVCTAASFEEGVRLGMLCWVTGGSKSRCRLSRTVSVGESGSRLSRTVSAGESGSAPETFASRAAGWGSAPLHL